MPEHGTYVYCITAGAGQAAPGVEHFRHGDLTAVARPALPADLAEAPADADEDTRLAWLQQRLQAHHAVVSYYFAAGPVLPFRFGVVLRPGFAAQALLSGNYAALCAALAEVQGREEWGVKFYLPRRGTESSGAVAPLPQRSGSGYLAARRTGRRPREAPRTAEAEMLEAAHRRFSRLAAAVQVQGERSTAALDPWDLGAVYLIPAAARPEFLAAAAEQEEGLRQQGIRLRLTGPWPPYSFCPQLQYET